MEIAIRAALAIDEYAAAAGGYPRLIARGVCWLFVLTTATWLTHAWRAGRLTGLGLVLGLAALGAAWWHGALSHRTS